MNRSDPVGSALAAFTPAPPELLARRELLRRVDAKYLVDVARLPELLHELASDYAVLRAGDRSIATYQNLYFDTPELQCFHDHRRGRRIRRKIRIRHYPDRTLSFLEIKIKRGELITDKRRLPIAFASEALATREQSFLEAHAGGLAGELAPILRVDYQRIALVNLDAEERITIDVEITASGEQVPLGCDGVPRRFGSAVVVEVKRAPGSRPRTPVMRALAAAGIRECSLSKYCVAVALVRSEVRNNRLRPSLRALEGYP